MKKWAAPVAPREQLLLLASCFDDQFPADHPIRQRGRRALLSLVLDAPRLRGPRLRANSGRHAGLLPNKDGGYASNYTPTVAVDRETGAILAAEVVDGNNEAAALAPALAAHQETHGQKPARVLADQTFATGDNLASLAQDGIAAAMPTGRVAQALAPRDRLPREQPRQPPRSDAARGARGLAGARSAGACAACCPATGGSSRARPLFTTRTKIVTTVRGADRFRA